MDNPRGSLIKVLDLIGYENDKEKFVNEFILLCFKKAYLSLVNTLPREKRRDLIEKNNIEELKEILSQTFSQKQAEEALKKATEDNFKSYLNAIMPTLKEEQKAKLITHLSAFAT